MTKIDGSSDNSNYFQIKSEVSIFKDETSSRIFRLMRIVVPNPQDGAVDRDPAIERVVSYKTDSPELKFVKDNVKEIDIKIDKNGDVNAVIAFNQKTIINQLFDNRGGEREKLVNLNLRFGGLCEIVCNKVLIENLLGKEDGSLLKNLTLDGLVQKNIPDSHLIYVYSIFEKIVAFLFGIYPNNIFSYDKQWDLVQDAKDGTKVKKVNREILNEGFDSLENGTTLKLEVFSRGLMSFEGHSLLVKKVDKDNFIFFDPNEGEYRNLTKDQVATLIDKHIIQWKASEIYFSRGDDYIRKLTDMKIIETVNRKPQE